MNAPPRRKLLEKRELSMPRTLEPYQMIERSIIKKYRDELWKPFVYAVKKYELIQAGDRSGTCIFQTYCSCDHIKLWKYAIKKMSSQSAGMIFQNDFQSFCLIFPCKHCRKSLETVFSF